MLGFDRIHATVLLARQFDDGDALVFGEVPIEFDSSCCVARVNFSLIDIVPRKRSLFCKWFENNGTTLQGEL